MLAIHHVGSQPLLQGMDGSGLRPETGELDFLSYFLGLQVDPLAAMQGNEGQVDISSLLAKGTEGEAGDEVLRSFFEKKEAAPWEVALMGGAMNAREPGAIKDPMSGLQTLSQATATPDFTNARLTKGMDARESALKASTDFRSDKLSEEFVTQLGQLNQANGLVSQNLSSENIIQKYQAAGNASVQDQMDPTVDNGRFQGLGANAQNGAIHSEITAKRELGEAKGSKNDGLGSVEKRKSLSVRGEDFGLEVGSGANGLKGVASGTAGIKSAAGKAERMDNTHEVFGKVQSLVYNGGGKMTVSLSPAHLGEVQIQVTTRGNKVEIEMQSESSSAKSILESSLGDLVQSIEAQDLVVSKMEVHVGRELDSSTAQGNFFAGGENASHQFQQGWSNHAEARQAWSGSDSIRSSRMPTVESAAPSMAARVATTRSGRVDLTV